MLLFNPSNNYYMPVTLFPEKGPGLAVGLPRAGWYSVWVLDFLQERFYNASPCDF